MNDFSSLSLPAPMQQAVASAEYTAMTQVQSAALPVILDARDVLGQAKTGSGETVAFALGVLAAFDASVVKQQGLVLCVTREPADQVSKEIRKLLRFIPNVSVLTLCGGVPPPRHLASLAHEPHMVVDTPGHILELIENEARCDPGHPRDDHAARSQPPRAGRGCPRVFSPRVFTQDLAKLSAENESLRSEIDRRDAEYRTRLERLEAALGDRVAAGR